MRQPRGSRGARITFTNLARMVMPLTFEVTYDDDSTETYRLPVELWFKSDRVTHTLPVTKEVRKVRIDPEQALPDSKRGNNVWVSKST